MFKTTGNHQTCTLYILEASFKEPHPLVLTLYFEQRRSAK